MSRNINLRPNYPGELSWQTNCFGNMAAAVEEKKEETKKEAAAVAEKETEDVKMETKEDNTMYLAASAAFSEWCLDVMLASSSSSSHDSTKESKHHLSNIFTEYVRNIRAMEYNVVVASRTGEYVFSGLSKCRTITATCFGGETLY